MFEELRDKMLNDSQLNQSSIKYDYDSDDTDNEKNRNINSNTNKVIRNHRIDSCESRDELSDDLNHRE